MKQSKIDSVEQHDADALETLYDAADRGNKAFSALGERVSAGGRLQRLRAGVWIVVHEEADDGGEV